MFPHLSILILSYIFWNILPLLTLSISILVFDSIFCLAILIFFYPLYNILEHIFILFSISFSRIHSFSNYFHLFKSLLQFTEHSYLILFMFLSSYILPIFISIISIIWNTFPHLSILILSYIFWNILPLLSLSISILLFDSIFCLIILIFFYPLYNILDIYSIHIFLSNNILCLFISILPYIFWNLLTL